MHIFPWKSRAANISKSEKRDALEVQGGGGLMNLGAIWEFLSGGASFNTSNEPITDWTALSISTVFTCVRILSDAVAQTPCLVYKQTPAGKHLDTENRLLHLLTIEANPEVSAYTFFETLIMHLMLRGNGYAVVQRNGAGDAVALWNLDPRKTEPVRVGVNRDLAYKTSDGMNQGQTRIVAAKDMVHMVLFSFDGVVGNSPVSLLRETLGLALSQHKFTARTLVNSAIPAVALTVQGKMAAEDKTKARDDWHRLQTGDNQSRLAILDNGMGIQTLGLSNVDQELLSSRQFSRTEIAAAFRVPAHMAGDTSRLTNGNAEQLALTFVTDTLSPLIRRLEVELKRKLAPPALNGMPNNTIITFDLRSRLRGDYASTMQAYAQGKQWGFLSTNDIRRDMGEDEIGAEGDVYWYPVNMANSSQLLLPASTEPTKPTPSTVVPDAAVRDTLATSATHMLTLYRDAVGRLAARSADKRDLHTVRKMFEPLAVSIAELGADSARRSTNAPEWLYEPTKAIADYLSKLTERSTTWNLDELDSIAASELQRVTKTLTLAAHRSIAEFTALKGLPNVA